jgi:hypothetical protein
VKVNAHSQWLGQIEKEVEARTAFLKQENPSDVNEQPGMPLRQL